jgi:O-antigen/teichoic acid export membrane protein
VIPLRAGAYASAAAGSWGAAVLQFLSGVILVRSLAPREVGVFVFGSAIATFVFGVLDLRIEEGLTQFLVRERHIHRQDRVKSALRYAVAVDVVSGIVIFSLTLSALMLIPLHLGHQTRLVAAIAAFASLIGISDGSFAAVLYAHQAFGWLSAYQIVANAARCLALLALPISSAADAAWAVALAQLAATVLVIAIVVCQFTPRAIQSERLTSTDRRWLLRFSLHVGLSSAVATVRATAIPLMLGAIGTKRQVADARVAESPTKLLAVAAAPLRTILFPRLSMAWARRDRAAARRLISHYILTTLVLGGILGTVMALTINTLLTKVYGSAYDHLERVGQFFVLAALLDAFAGWQKVAPAALDRPWLRTLIVAGECSALVATLAILAPRYGALGASISATVAGAVSLAMGAYWLAPALANASWGESVPLHESRPED